ncbi:MAG: formylglycine-generating enzyme family protein [Rhodobacterales bacterium]|nr:formylglycine-generating enzyme family protein [Rhodobacterales bacterium]MDX5413935.1 formylglycine-generating enzyme family protein [Rhodobacterales bacterium]
MTAAARPPLSRRTSLALLGLVPAVILVGAVLMQRGPDPALLPDMTEHPVVIAGGRAIYVQRHEVTIADWNRCVAQKGCRLELRAPAQLDPATTPATGLSYSDAMEYIDWINRTTGHVFRLPTLAEWDAMAAPVLPEASAPLFTDPSLTWASSYLTEGLAPRLLKTQGSFSTSPDGIADLDGSVWEWTQDCYAGTAEGVDPDRCPAFFVGGEHVAAIPFLVRDPARGGCAVGSPPAHLGMRLVSDDPV